MFTQFFSQRLFSQRFDRRRIPSFFFRWFPVFALAWALVYGIPAVAQKKQQKTATSASEKSSGGSAARGKYIVESVAMCGVCHTPRDSEGNPDRSHWLQGGSLPFMPSQPASDWPVRAPRIGGNPPASDADMVKLLMTGIWTTGDRLRFPMPQFRMDKGDAEAVVAYLKSATGKQEVETPPSQGSK